MSSTTVATRPADTNGSVDTHDREARSMRPRVDVIEDGSSITLLADMPGVPKDRLDIKVEGDTLTIDGTITTQAPEGLEPVYAEVRASRYWRAFTLSRELDPAGITANLADGVLTLRVPKQAHAQPRRIEIQSS